MNSNKMNKSFLSSSKLSNRLSSEVSSTARLPSVQSSFVDEVFSSFNEILGVIGPFQIWTSFLILISGVSVSWQTLAYTFYTQKNHQNCIQPPDIDFCSPECEKKYNFSMRATSIIYEWGLLCENSYKADLGYTVLMGGMMFGCLFYGHVADQLGRRPTFLSACMVVLVLGVIVGLSQWFWFFCLTYFILGIGCGGMTIICIVFLVEYVDFSKRELLVVLYRLPYTLGHGTLTALVLFISSWRILQIFISTFAVIYISYFWLLPESPRWLFITGQLERCIAILRSGAKRNHRPTQKIRNIIEKAYDVLRSQNFDRSGTMVDLFKAGKLRKNTCILLFAWFTNYLKFYGILDFLGDLDSNLLRNFGISAWLSIPSTLLAYPVVKYVPRRYSLLGTFGLSAILMLIIPFLPNKEDILVIVIGAVVLVLMTIATCIMHLYTAELFPTILRNSGMGLSICCGSFGMMMAPYVNRSFTDSFWTPACIFGCFSLTSAVILMFLPETKGQILFDTIEETASFGQKKRTTM